MHIIEILGVVNKQTLKRFHGCQSTFGVDKLHKAQDHSLIPLLQSIKIKEA